MPKTTLTTLQAMKQSGEKITMLTAYDYSFAKIIDTHGVDVVLVGDSLGMVIQGHETTVPVTVEDIIYHTKAVTRATEQALVIADLPFMSYAFPEQAVLTAAKVMQESQAEMIKLEGGEPQVQTVRSLAGQGIPVCAHLGLQPQSVHKLGGYRVQGRDKAHAKRILADAKALQEAGADMLILECVPVDLAERITKVLTIPVIGIGAGVACDGQVLVLQDVLGISPKAPKFAENFMQDGRNIQEAVLAYTEAVKQSVFPAKQHCFF